MATLLYNPGVRVLIDTENHGIVDISEDIKDGSVTLRENAVASVDLAVINHRRKYDGVFAPNDRIHIQLKRINWLPIFSGYLDEVPYYSVYPRIVPIKASCTLKRLKYRYWDPGAAASVQILQDVSGGDFTNAQDGGLASKVKALLTNVADWPEQNIHIGRIPDSWSEKFAPLKAEIEEALGEVSTVTLGEGGLIAGTSPLSIGLRLKTPDGLGTGSLPSFTGRAIAAPINAGRARELPMEVNSGYQGDFYIFMRWPYRQSDLPKDDPESLYLEPSVTQHAKNWWKEQRILLVNPKNNKAVIVIPVGWGPDPGTNRDMVVSDATMNALEATGEDSLQVRFVRDDVALNSGPVPVQDVVQQQQQDSGGSVTSAAVGTVGGVPSQAYAASPDQVSSASGLRFASKENLRPHVAACFDFIKAGWEQTGTIGGYANRNIAGTNRKSDHAKGLALDVHACSIGSEPTASQVAFGNSVAQWFVANPLVFNVDYVIWQDKINSGSGWRPYKQSEWGAGNRHPSPTQGHRDHVHISFKDVQQTQPGQMGSPWPGSDSVHLTTTVFAPTGQPVGAGGGFGGVFDSSGPLLAAAGNWVPQINEFSEMLQGYRALINDEPIYETISKLTMASMRSHMAAPNGDFIAWFPDYFGMYGTAGRMIVRDIEIANQGFTLSWADEGLVTHQFVASSLVGYTTEAQAPGGEVTIENQMYTHGIASVEFPKLMEALFNISRDDDPRSKYFRDAEAILQRFSARVNYQPFGMAINREAEFWYACHLFLKSWANQFSSSVELSFMPEVYPGMLLRLEGLGLQVYVTAVTHSFDFNGGGFTTRATVVAPSATDRSGIFGLPLAGDVRSGAGSGGGGRNLKL